MEIRKKIERLEITKYDILLVIFGGLSGAMTAFAIYYIMLSYMLVSLVVINYIHVAGVSTYTESIVVHVFIYTPILVVCAITLWLISHEVESRAEGRKHAEL